MAEPNFNIRQNTCPLCGYYDWAHPIPGICVLTPETAKGAYEAQAIFNRLYISLQRPDR